MLDAIAPPRTELIESGELFRNIGLPSFDPAVDRAMICGSPTMLADTRRLLDARGFEVSAHIGAPGDYVFERAFSPPPGVPAI